MILSSYHNREKEKSSRPGITALSLDLATGLFHDEKTSPIPPGWVIPFSHSLPKGFFDFEIFSAVVHWMELDALERIGTV